MDFPVKATIHLYLFRSGKVVKSLLGSYGFKVTDLGGDQVHVAGSFLKLKAVKAHLEQILESQSKTTTSPHSSSPPQTVSCEAISNYYTNRTVSGGKSGRSGSRDEPLQASPSLPITSASWGSNSSHSHPTSSENRASFLPGADQHASFRQGSESFMVDSDVFRYAKSLRKKDIDGILENHNVGMAVCECGDGLVISLLGKSARLARSKLQDLLSDLNLSLRTQEVHLKDMHSEGMALLERMRRNNHIYDSVVVCETNDRLHLIGPSGQSYEVKQKLLGRQTDQARRAGRTLEKSSRGRSSSLPPTNRLNTQRETGAVAKKSPVGAAGYSPKNYQDDKRFNSEPGREYGVCLKQRGPLKARSSSLSRKAERPIGMVQESGNKCKPPLRKMFSLKNMKQKIETPWK